MYSQWSWCKFVL